MIRLDAAAVLLQWATGGMLFLWVTTRHRTVGLGYGWMMRGTYLLIGVGALAVGRFTGTHAIRDVFILGFVLATAGALVVSITRRKAGVAGQIEVEQRRSERVAAMTGIDRSEVVRTSVGPEFPPVLDLVAAGVGTIGLVIAAFDAGGSAPVSLMRMLIGAAFLGAVSDAMLLGHWYLVQPGLARSPILELVRWLAALWPFEVIALLLPTGMISVLNGTIDDGWNGLLAWYWVASAAATIILVAVTRAALKEREYSAVMAATGLLYLAILTAFGTDLVARALLTG